MARKPGPKVDPLLEEIKPKTVMLDQLTVDMLKAVGQGNVSNGVRLAARIAYDRYQRTPEKT